MLDVMLLIALTASIAAGYGPGYRHRSGHCGYRFSALQ